MARKGDARVFCATCGKEIYWSNNVDGWVHTKEPKTAHEPTRR